MNQLAAFNETVALAEERGMGAMSGTTMGLEHLRDMQDRILDQPLSFSEAKLGRWLGWAQACVVFADIGITLEDVKQINKRHS